ncbi:sensor histidine kinase [Sphingomicrobium marinum]|uniref:sensor histidine kinase n=1 Tax=Sphingomicrobium marinum TaxID=1227950 RepID=UPI00223F5B52|nr:ATP-binding protein [Sphingomicrobium marinum]
MGIAESILDAFEDPLLVVNGQRIKTANIVARDLLGQRIVDADIRLAIRHPEVLELLEQREAAEIDVEGIGRTERPWHVIVQPIGDHDMLVRLVDRAAARAAERMRVDFVANASHELRTPLATIMGYAETLAEDAVRDKKLRRKFAKTIRQESQRMLQIVEDLMGLSRIESHRFVAPRDKVDLGAVAADAVDNLAELAQRRDCRITLDVESDIPPITADTAQIEQLIDNLIANAIRYGCNETSNAVEVSVARTRDRVRLVVRDDGDGIAPEHLPRLTERFYRVDAARSREKGGTGLGLAIVKHIVERHRGTLDIASAPGAGTRVTVDLPLPRDATRIGP